MASNSDRRSDSSAHSSRRSPGTRATGKTTRGTGSKKTIEINVSKRIAAERNQPAVTARGSQGARDKSPRSGRSGTSTTTRSRGGDRTNASRDAQSDLRRAGRKIADAKASDRARREREARRRARLRLLLITLCVAVVLGGSFAIYRSTFLKVEKVQVTGTSRLTQAEILDLAAISPDETMLRVPKKAIAARILKNPFVAEVRISRNLPSTLVIRVTERSPLAVIEMPNAGAWLISGDRHWLAPASAEETASMLVVRSVPDETPKAGAKSTGDIVANALEIVEGLSPELREMTASINAPSIGKTELVTKQGVAIFLGSSDQLEVKDELARRILAENPGKVVYINVRVVDRPTWRGL